MPYIVVRMRSGADRSERQERTLNLLRLTRIHHATIVPENDSAKGMVKKVEHFITYGELDAATAVKLLETRGRAPGNRPLTDEVVAEHTSYGSIKEFAEALAKGEADISKFEGIKPIFRLAPAKGGFEGKKRHFNEGGALGYRGKEINALVERML